MVRGRRRSTLGTTAESARTNAGSRHGGNADRRSPGTRGGNAAGDRPTAPPAETPIAAAHGENADGVPRRRTRQQRRTGTTAGKALDSPAVAGDDRHHGRHVGTLARCPVDDQVARAPAAELPRSADVRKCGQAKIAQGKTTGSSVLWLAAPHRIAYGGRSAPRSNVSTRAENLQEGPKLEAVFYKWPRQPAFLPRTRPWPGRTRRSRRRMLGPGRLVRNAAEDRAEGNHVAVTTVVRQDSPGAICVAGRRSSERCQASETIVGTTGTAPGTSARCQAPASASRRQSSAPPPEAPARC
jgi:hypothetical protein